LVDRFLHSIGLITPTAGHVARRAIFCSLITWVPVLILTLVSGLAFGGRVRIVFLQDFVAHVRFLVAAPLLIVAEVVVGPRVKGYARHFISSGLVPETELQEFKSALTETIRLRDLTIVDVLLFILAYAVVAYRAMNLSANEISSWRAFTTESGMHITLAGWWYALVSIPIFQFLVYRWLWRLIIWARLLWRMSRLDLRLTPTHPDLAAGLGFLGIAPATFGIIPFALDSLLGHSRERYHFQRSLPISIQGGDRWLRLAHLDNQLRPNACPRQEAHDHKKEGIVGIRHARQSLHQLIRPQVVARR
jgi:hypothetical protein